MTYYTIEFTDGRSAWIHKEFKSIAKYDSIVRAQGIADYLLKSDPILKYNIIKHEQEVVRTKEKEKELPKTRDKIVFKIQFESCIPYKWLDTDGEFNNVLHAQMILDSERKSWPDRSFRLVKRDYYYEELVVN